MNDRPTVLCPVDFSDASRAALLHARGIAQHFGSRLIVLTVEDPLLTEAVDLSMEEGWHPEDTRRELARFVTRLLLGNPLAEVDVEYEVRVGNPAAHILDVARARECDLIVMSTHGLTGIRKLFFGSTTERVLRETMIPVLAVHPLAEPPHGVGDMQRVIGRILVPVDLSSSSVSQVQVARRIAEALAVPLVVTHVVEPVRSPLATRLHLTGIELERRARAEDALADLTATLPRRLHAEALVAYGDPAEEISKISHDRRAGLIVVGLHGSPVLGPRMGSVTYRILCLSTGLVLALPPGLALKPAEDPAKGTVAQT
jgi:universal stress protein A